VKYLITGGSGYIGNRLTAELAARDDTELVINLDVHDPTFSHGKAEFVRGDVRDRPAIRELLERHQPDALVHLAFIFNPIHDEARMYDINVNGTQAVLWAASEAGTQQVLVTSSASAYGAWPDNPNPIAEDWPVRGQPDFSYPRHKAEADRLCQLWAAEHPDRVMTIVRPTIVFGPNVDNFISQQLEKVPRTLLFDGVDGEFQFVHEDDATAALIALLDARAGGAFNLAADGTARASELGALLGRKTQEIPYHRARQLFGLMWRMHLPQATSPPGSLAFSRYEWIVSTEKLKAATDWKPRFTSRETFEITMRAKGRLPAVPAPAQQTTASP
jgi:UDP-glucose 4-epimerase